MSITIPPATKVAGQSGFMSDINNTYAALASVAGVNVLNTAYSGGADPTGSADSTAAITAAYSAVSAAGGTIFLPAGTYKVSSPLPIATGVRYIGSGKQGTIITSTSASSIWNFPANAFWWEVADLTARNTGGHIFAGSHNLSAFTVRRCSLQSNSNTGSIWAQSSGNLIEAWFTECDLSQGGSAPSVAAFALTDVNGSFNANTFTRCVCTMQNAATAYFFDWECTNASGFSYGNCWRDIVFEQCSAGCIKGVAHLGAVLDNVQVWDGSTIGSSTADFITFLKNSSNIGSRGITIRNCMRSNSTLGASKSDISFDAFAQQVLVQNYRAAPDNAAINLAGLTGAKVTGLSVGVTLSGATTTAAAAAGAGTGPPSPVATQGPTNECGKITWGTGTSPAAGSQVTVTFGTPFAQTPVIVLTPATSVTGALQGFPSSVSASGFTIATATAPSASQANTTYGVNWQAVT